MTPESPARLSPASELAPPAAYEVGPNRPPLATRWRKGVSGNPLGRPRNSAAGAGLRRSILPPLPDMERALSRPVDTAYFGEPYRSVTLSEMLVNELTQMVSTQNSVAAARELLHWIAETERGRVERAALEAEAVEAAAEAEREAAEAQAQTEREAREAEAAHALARAEAAQREALDQLKTLAVQEHDDDCDGDCDGDCFEAREDEMLIDRALVRLGVGVADESGSVLLKPWVIEAALARAPALELAESEKATLALVTAPEPGDDGVRAADWVERLEGVAEPVGKESS